MAEGGKILARILQELKGVTRPGISKIKLDKLARQKIKAAGAQPAFLGYRGFPAALCVCRNNELVHSIPDQDKICDGDVVCLDLGIKYHGFCTDAAITIGVGKISMAAQKLIDICQKSLEAGIWQMKPGNYLSDVQTAIATTIQKAGLHVVRDLTGHGIGRKLQEYPPILNLPQGLDFKLKAGMVFAIEPMVGNKTAKIKISDNGWTVTVARGLGVHFEHTIAITASGRQVLTA